MAKPVKTNVLRHLDAAKIPYETIEYDVSDENYDGKRIAQKSGLPMHMVYKTLVLMGDRSPVGSKNQYLVCVIPVDKELDLKAVARAAGHKAVTMLPQKELLPLTGYVHGGCSPVGMKKPFPTWIDETALLTDAFFCSAGRLGAQIGVDPEALAGYIGASFADLTEE